MNPSIKKTRAWIAAMALLGEIMGWAGRRTEKQPVSAWGIDVCV